MKRLIRNIHQIEVTSRCNLRCRYCPHPKMNRAKIDMSAEMYLRALTWVQHFADRGGQPELSLTGVGEPLLHPLFVEFVASARAVLPRSRIVFSTNGILFDQEMAERLAPYLPMVYVSGHRPEKAGIAVHWARQYGIYAGLNTKFIDEPFDWAEQVDWPVVKKNVVCAYLLEGHAVVLSDGSIVRCCLDAEGIGTLAHVNEEPRFLYTTDFRLCETCHMRVPEQSELTQSFDIIQGARRT